MNTQSTLPWHTTPASALCPQLWIPHPLKEHLSKNDSEPLQATSSIQMVPLPWPNSASVEALTVPLYPSCLHTTWVHAQKSNSFSFLTRTHKLRLKWREGTKGWAIWNQLIFFNCKYMLHAKLYIAELHMQLLCTVNNDL